MDSHARIFSKYLPAFYRDLSEFLENETTLLIATNKTCFIMGPVVVASSLRNGTEGIVLNPKSHGPQVIKLIKVASLFPALV